MSIYIYIYIYILVLIASLCEGYKAIMMCGCNTPCIAEIRRFNWSSLVALFVLLLYLRMVQSNRILYKENERPDHVVVIK